MSSPNEPRIPDPLGRGVVKTIGRSFTPIARTQLTEDCLGKTPQLFARS
jgi:hypothetical protein